MTLHTVVPVRADGGTGSVRVSGMQPSSGVTKLPDAVRRQEHGQKVLECGGIFSAAKLSRAAAPKQNDWGGFKQAKVCLLAINCQQSKSD